jgi:hypothetical protein
MRIRASREFPAGRPGGVNEESSSQAFRFDLERIVVDEDQRTL